MTIKKAYVQIIELLEANSNKKVSTILDQVKELCESKNSGGSDIGTTFIKNDQDETIAIFCYYFKKWMSVEDVEFGRKANTASGYNTMCKEGVRLWTKQQRVAKLAKEQLLDDIVEQVITVEELPEQQAIIEAKRKLIAEAEEPLLHFDTAEEILAHIANQYQNRLCLIIKTYYKLTKERHNMLTTIAELEDTLPFINDLAKDGAPVQELKSEVEAILAEKEITWISKALSDFLIECRRVSR